MTASAFHRDAWLRSRALISRMLRARPVATWSGLVTVILAVAFLAGTGMRELFTLPDSPQAASPMAESGDAAPESMASETLAGVHPDSRKSGEPDRPGEDNGEPVASRTDPRAAAMDGDTTAVTESGEATDGATPGTGDDEAEGGDPEDPGLRIAGSVLDDRGHLLPGMTVIARPAHDGGGSQRMKVTDANGMFSFGEVDEGEYDLSAGGDEVYREAHLRVRAGIASAELRLQRQRAIRVFGIVTGEGNRPLDSVRVRALGGNSGLMTDPSGIYELTVDLVRAGQPPVIEFSRADYREKRERIEAALAAERDAVRLDVQLEPSDLKVALGGTVTGPENEPVEGVKVWLSSPDPRDYQQTVTGGAGEFHFAEVEIGDSYRAGVDPGPEYNPFVSEAFAVGPTDTVWDMQLEEAGEGWLSGRVVDPEGQPLEGLTLWLRRTDAGGRSPLAFQTASGGRFSVDKVPAGELRVESRSQPYLEASGIRLLPGESRDVVVPLDWGPHWLFGQVVDGAGAPVPQARVVLQWGQQYPDVYSVSRREVSTDRLGYFTFSNLGAGDHVLTVMAQGYPVVRSIQDPRLAAEDLRIALVAGRGGGSGGH